MSFFARLFHGNKKKAHELVNRAPAANPEAPEPVRSAPGALDELRFRARTGDVKLTDRHHTGNF